MKKLLLFILLFVAGTSFAQNVSYSDEPRQYDTLYLVQQNVFLQSIDFMQNSNLQPGDTLVLVAEPAVSGPTFPEIRAWKTYQVIDSLFMMNMGYVKNYISDTEADVRALSDMTTANRDTTFRLVAFSYTMEPEAIYRPIQLGELHVKIATGDELELNDFVAKSGAQTFFLNVTNLTSEGLSNWLENPTGLGLKKTENVQFELFPNPTVDLLNIVVGDAQANIYISNMEGKVVFRTQGTGNVKVDTSNFAAGLYAVSVNGATQSFVKK